MLCVKVHASMLCDQSKLSCILYDKQSVIVQGREHNYGRA